MGQTARTTKLLLDLTCKDQRGANTQKRGYLEATVTGLDAARRFYLMFFFAHPEKLLERVEVISRQTGEVRSALISADKLLTWAEFQTVETDTHPYPLPDWNFSQLFPDFPNRYFEQRRNESGWEQESPTLVLGKQAAAIHFLQTKQIAAKKISESKQDPDLVTVAVDLNVKYLAVITVRQHERLIHTRFVSDQGLDQHRSRHLKRVAKKQWQSGKPIKGERSNQQLWRHIRRQNTDAAHKTARAIVEVCEQYPGCVLLFERLRVIKPSGGSKSRRRNRKQANQLKGQINQLAKEKAYAKGVVSVEVNAHGTSQYCSRCGQKGVRFTYRNGQRVPGKGGKLFFCPACRYECHADFNASANVHHSFYRELHWQPRLTRSG